MSPWGQERLNDGSNWNQHTAPIFRGKQTTPLACLDAIKPLHGMEKDLQTDENSREVDRQGVFGRQKNGSGRIDNVWIDELLISYLIYTINAHRFRPPRQSKGAWRCVQIRPCQSLRLRIHEKGWRRSFKFHRFL